MNLSDLQVTLYKESEKPGKWEPTTSLIKHELRVTGIDWAPKTNRIVTCSADRNAFVWDLQPDGTWTQVLVLLRYFPQFYNLLSVRLWNFKDGGS